MVNIQRLYQSGAVYAQRFGDLSGIRARHTIAGAPTIVPSVHGPVMHFGGTNDYVTLGVEWEEPLRFDSGTQDFSVVAWVRRAVTGVTHTIFHKCDAAGDGWELRIAVSNVVYGLINNRLVAGPAVVADALWHCITLTVDRSGNGIVYIDGAPGTPVAMGGEVMATTVVPRIGARAYDAGTKFNGDIHSIAIIDRVLTPTEVDNLARSKPFESEDHLVSRYSMSNVNPPDEGWRGLGYDGVGTGLVAATDVIDGVGGGKALEFDGTEYVTTSFAARTAQMTYAGWVRFDSLAADSAIWSGTAIGTCPMLRVKDNGRTYFWADVGQASVALGAAGTYDLRRWYHWALTFDEDADEAGLYLDGELVEIGVMAADYNPAACMLTIATRNAGADNMVGAQDDFRIYDEILTLMQIRDLWRRSMRGATGG